MVMLNVLPATVQVSLAAVVLIAGVYDFRYRRIPNRLTIPAAALGLVANVVLHGWGGLAVSCLGAGLALLVYLPMYLLRGMGAGDVKLMFALGALTGPTSWFDIFVTTALVGALLGVIVAVLKRRFIHTLLNLQHLLTELLHHRLPHDSTPELDVRSTQALRLPHGVSIALGSLLVLALPFAFNR